MMFLTEGFGTARDDFSRGLIRLKNVRGYLAARLDEELRNAQEAEKTFNENLRAIRSGRAMTDQEMRRAAVLSAQQMMGSEELFLWIRGVEGAQPEERRITRELIVVYLVMLLDHFFVQWRAEKGLGKGGAEKGPEAGPDQIEASGNQLVKKQKNSALQLRFQDESKKHLKEIRKRRDIIVHLRSIADVGYAKVIEDASAQGKLVETTDRYLDGALEFVDKLVAAMVYKTCGRAITSEQQATVSEVFQK